ncbi:MAG: chromosome segregation protein SMC [Deltaproteobacteria bacterium RIFOXYD12_FULL_57_12]|nr:MAG: chromosome segregation protein SMC [Deltaproteobacteria bacterium RIFOXYD12_FULL_57_12]
MITRLTLRNFKKSVGEQIYDFGQFDLLVGRNNSGKGTVLQALAIWQFCVDEFHRTKRTGKTGIQVVLPNFTALPVPEFNLLWKDRTDRAYPVKDGKKKQEFILIEIVVEWQRATGETASFGVNLRYHSPQTIYAIPSDGWTTFREYEQLGDLPRIAYVPPFSGLEPGEKWLDVSPIRQQVGKAQPGSVLRNLLLWVCPSPPLGPDGRVSKDYTPPADWLELVRMIERWFSVTISAPKYETGKDVYITVEYREKDKDYDIIAGGSGFHQALTLLAFLYGYRPTTILLDEPDAHLHVNLQREILDYFKRNSAERKTQFLIATHAEEFVRGVDASQIVSLLGHTPTRIQSTPEVLRAMAEVSNEELTRLLTSPYILYVEGESDERILRAWADRCGAQTAMDKVYFRTMGGGGKENMKERADEHFKALQQVIPQVSRLMLFDYDERDNVFHPEPDNPTLAEWKRKNIENYLLVPEAWKRTAQRLGGNLFALPVLPVIDDFFVGQNLTLPPGKTWRNVTANVFSVVDGKRILFENNDSLFHQLRNGSPSLQLIREQVAMSMTADELHEDVHQFIGKLTAMLGTA